MQVKLHQDYQPLLGATGRFKRKIPTYDDGWGELYILMLPDFACAIVRAGSWYDAYSICEDEFFPEAPSWEEMLEETGSSDVESATNTAIWQERYAFRPNGPSTSEHTSNEHGHGVYAIDGSELVPLTESILQDHEIKLDAEPDWDGIRSAVLDLQWTDGHGIYIPHLFCADVSDNAYRQQTPEVRECIDTLKLESSVHKYEHYWEDWLSILDGYTLNGHTLHQDGDLWFVDQATLARQFGPQL